jgi:ubiquitin-protein ligase
MCLWEYAVVVFAISVISKMSETANIKRNEQEIEEVEEEGMLENMNELVHEENEETEVPEVLNEEEQDEDGEEEEDIDEAYEYRYSSGEEDGDEEGRGTKRPLDVMEDSFSSKRKYLDADGYSLRIWSEGNVFRMAIVAAVRQIIDHPSNQFRILCSSDQLDDTDLEELVLSVFVDVQETMTVVYQLKFSTLVEMGMSPPRLKCLTYCGFGTYLFPEHLLPNRFTKFMNFGKLFFDLAEELQKYDKKMIPFYSIAETSFCSFIQDLSYKTQYETRAILHTSDSSVVTGLERKTDGTVTEGRRGLRKGIGYSVGYEGNIKIDNSYLESLILQLEQLSTLFPTTFAPNLPNILESPLAEILTLLMSEYSFEDLIRNPNFTRPLLVLIGKMESLHQSQLSGAMISAPPSPGTASDVVPALPASAPSSSLPGWLFSRDTYEKIARFQEIVGNESDQDFGLSSLQLPEEVQEIHFQKLSVSPQSHNSHAALKSSAEEPIDAVTFADSFRHHTYFVSGKPMGSSSLTPKFLRRMRVEFATLRSSLPETIKLLVLESNYAYLKFLIVGPSDTPYEGGFFVFDMHLPADYPDKNPQVTLLTTGGGRVRFNPNLYNCGKVCLSLLGTWAGERWDPKISNINQVLQSICFLILVPEPYFNEPGYDQQQGTSRGDEESRKYSDNIRVQTIRHAVLDHLTHPDPEFGQIINRMLRGSWNHLKEVYRKWATEDRANEAEIQRMIVRIETQLAKG